MRARSRAWARTTALGGLAALTTSCFTTRDEGDALKRDMGSLQAEMAQMQRLQSDARAQDAAVLDDLRGRVAALESTLGNLRQADADVGVQLDKVVAELQTLRGEVEQARHELGETSASVKDILARPPVTVAAAASAPRVETQGQGVTIDGQEVPVGAKPHYEFAKKLYDDKKFAESADAFDLFLQRHAKNAPDLADNAAYWKGESHFAQAGAHDDAKLKEKSLKQAILAYQRVVEDLKSEKNDAALYKSGLAFELLGFMDEATVFFEELVSKHGKSPLAPDARKRIKALAASKKRRR